MLRNDLVVCKTRADPDRNQFFFPRPLLLSPIGQALSSYGRLPFLEDVQRVSGFQYGRAKI
jgi:hypothetical protein